MLHFAQVGVQLAPKTNGGAYILSADQSNNDRLFVLHVDSKGNVESHKDLGKNGNPFDIETTPWGFVYMWGSRCSGDDCDHLEITGVNADGS